MTEALKPVATMHAHEPPFKLLHSVVYPDGEMTLFAVACDGSVWRYADVGTAGETRCGWWELRNDHIRRRCPDVEIPAYEYQ